MKKYYKESRRKETPYIQQKEGRKANCTSHALVGNALPNMLLEESQKGMRMRRKT